jgi:hypothetical protein
MAKAQRPIDRAFHLYVKSGSRWVLEGALSAPTLAEVMRKAIDRLTPEHGVSAVRLEPVAKVNATK